MLKWPEKWNDHYTICLKSAHKPHVELAATLSVLIQTATAFDYVQRSRFSKATELVNNEARTEPRDSTGTLFPFNTFYQFYYIFPFVHDQTMSKLMITMSAHHF